MTRREELLTWIKDGDPGKMPMLFWVGGDLPNVWFGKEGNYGYEDQIRAANELGSQLWFRLAPPEVPELPAQLPATHPNPNDKQNRH